MYDSCSGFDLVVSITVSHSYSLEALDRLRLSAMYGLWPRYPGVSIPSNPLHSVYMRLMRGLVEGPRQEHMRVDKEMNT